MLCIVAKEGLPFRMSQTLQKCYGYCSNYCGYIVSSKLSGVYEIAKQKRYNFLTVSIVMFLQSTKVAVLAVRQRILNGTNNICMESFSFYVLMFIVP